MDDPDQWLVSAGIDFKPKARSVRSWPWPPGNGAFVNARSGTLSFMAVTHTEGSRTALRT
jgi:hypothetical protein